MGRQNPASFDQLSPMRPVATFAQVHTSISVVYINFHWIRGTLEPISHDFHVVIRCCNSRPPPNDILNLHLPPTHRAHPHLLPLRVFYQARYCRLGCTISISLEFFFSNFRFFLSIRELAFLFVELPFRWVTLEITIFASSYFNRYPRISSRLPLQRSNRTSLRILARMVPGSRNRSQKG